MAAQVRDRAPIHRHQPSAETVQLPIQVTIPAAPVPIPDAHSAAEADSLVEAVTAAAAAEAVVSQVEVAGAADDANHCILQTLFPYDRERTTLDFSARQYCRKGIHILFRWVL